MKASEIKTLEDLARYFGEMAESCASGAKPAWHTSRVRDAYENHGRWLAYKRAEEVTRKLISRTTQQPKPSCGPFHANCHCD